MSLSKVVAFIGLVSCSHPPRVLYGSERHAPEVMASPKRNLRPIVEAGESREKCFFKDDNNSWCFNGISPVLRTGWDVDQEPDESYWLYQFKPYLET